MRFDYKKIIQVLIGFGFIIFLFTNCFGIDSFTSNKEEMYLLGDFFIVKSCSGSIQKAIDSLPENGGTIFTKANTYVLKKGILIKRSNVNILGEKGVIIRLTDEKIPKLRIRNISLSDLEIDGNRENQESEFNPEKLWIRCIWYRCQDG